MTTSSLTLPPIEVLASAAAELVEQTQDRPTINALNKAALQLHAGVVPVATSGGFLIESRTRAMVHRVSTLNGCSCEAGQKNKACWHVALIQIVEKAQTRAIPSLSDRIAARRQVVIQADDWGTRYDRWSAQRKAEAEMDELFA